MQLLRLFRLCALTLTALTVHQLTGMDVTKENYTNALEKGALPIPRVEGFLDDGTPEPQVRLLALYKPHMCRHKYNVI